MTALPAGSYVAGGATPTGPANLGLTTAALTYNNTFQTLPMAPDQTSQPFQSQLRFGTPYNRTDGSGTVYTDTSMTLSDGSTPNPFALSSPGSAVITASYLNGLTAIAPGQTTSNWPSEAYQSGSITTLPSFHQDWGYYEFTGTMPVGAGAWGAFYLYPYSDVYPLPTNNTCTTGEVDLDEESGIAPSTIQTTTHWKDVESTDAQGHVLTCSGENTIATNYLNSGTNLQSGTHVLGFDFEPAGITRYVDNVQLDATPLAIPPEFQSTAKSWYMVLAQNADTISAWGAGDKAQPANYPKNMVINQVRVFRTQNTVLRGGSAMLPASSLSYYVGYPNLIAGSLANMGGLLTKRPSYYNVYVDQTAPKSGWAGNSSFLESTFAADNSGLLPMLFIPMSASADGDTATAAFQSIIAGNWDSYFQGMFAPWRNGGFKKGVLRIGIEFNLSTFNWAVTTPAQASLYGQAFAHIAALARDPTNGLGPGWQMAWNPSYSYPGITGLTVAQSYPGNSAVDIILIDVYDNMYPGYSNGWASDVSVGTAGWSVPMMVSFAQANNKSYGIGEAGAGSGSNGQPSDNPAFFNLLTSDLQAGNPLQDQVGMIQLWSAGVYDFSQGTKPNQAAAAAAMANQF